MPSKARRTRPRKPAKSSLPLSCQVGTTGDWLKRWEAAVPYAAARFARVMRDQTEVIIDKYIKSLQRSLILNAKRRERRPGA